MASYYVKDSELNCSECSEELNSSDAYVCENCEAVVCQTCYEGGMQFCPECGGELMSSDTFEEEMQ